jgi:prevent-host-death family protein
MVMSPRTISKAHFKARALEILRQVETTGEPILITDRGRAVLKIAPYFGDDDAVLASLRGSVLRYEDPTEPVATDDWESLS